MATKKKTGTSPAEVSTEEVKRIPAGQFLLDSGLLFEINRTVLHPLGLDLDYLTDEQRFIVNGYHDMEDTVGMKYVPQHFAEGRAKHLQMMNAWGYARHLERQKRLGFVMQEK